MIHSFDDITLKNIADRLSNILTHSQITELFSSKNFIENKEASNKSNRLFYAFKTKQQNDNCGNNIIDFVITIINPRRYNNEADYERDRLNLNEKLIYEGIEIDRTGKVQNTTRATTISDAKRRSKKLKETIHGIGIHPDILPYCEEEWLKEDYFHAIFEITKSVAEKLRSKSGYISDGAMLVDECFKLGHNNQPTLAFNKLQTETEISEHKGFSNFCKGYFGMYRNPKAHIPSLLDDSQLTQMTEVLVISSIIHKKLDATYKTGY